MSDIEIAQLTDRLMRRIHVALTQKAPRFDHHKLGPGGGMLLLAMADIEPARPQALAAAVARDKSQMTRAVHALEAKGLLTKTDDPEDGRASLLELTDLGQEAVAAMQGAIAETLGEILVPLSEQEQSTFRDLLRRI